DPATQETLKNIQGALPDLLKDAWERYSRTYGTFPKFFRTAPQPKELSPLLKKAAGMFAEARKDEGVSFEGQLSSFGEQGMILSFAAEISGTMAEEKESARTKYSELSHLFEMMAQLLNEKDFAETRAVISGKVIGG
ncbi:MAG TPA: hypothetical protein VJ179_02425, partial [Patescibacteria group bacterium]|nr:hypothetical protein [Patescibacteria group bacterium]